MIRFLPSALLAGASLALCCLSTSAHAKPVSVADCLRAAAAASDGQLLAQALPATSGSAASAGAAADAQGPALLSQAAQPESLPACTYDPPRPAVRQTIRGLW